MIDYFWLVIVLPLIGVLFNGLLGRRMGHRVVSIVGSLVILLAFIVGILSFFQLSASAEKAVVVPLWQWVTIGDLDIAINLLVDPLSLTMVLIITGIGFLISRLCHRLYGPSG